jgi:peptidoglycan/LPS O-acetylase OafA/YrhL
MRSSSCPYWDSYYLFHCIALWVGCTVLAGLPEPLQWSAAVALTTVMSVASYRFLEKPAIDLGARLAEKWDDRLQLRPIPPRQ